MRKQIYTVFTITILTSPWMVSFAIESPAQSPIGSPTVPPSSIRNNLIDTGQGNYGTSENLLGTGYNNHFRGIMPYGSTVIFEPGLGLTSFESFIRRSAEQSFIDQHPALTELYYLPPKTIASFKSGNEYGLMPPNTLNLGTGLSGFALHPSLKIEGDISNRQQRPLSMNTNEMQILIDQQLELKRLSRQGEDFLEEDSGEIEKDDLYLEYKPDKEEEPKKESDYKQQEQIYLQPEDQTEMTIEDQLFQELEEQESEQPSKAEKEEENKYKIERPEGRKVPEMDTSKVKEILGSHKDFKSLAEANFKKYIQAAREFLKEGKYYRAADAYTLANVWDNKHPLTFIGRALALFAAGEYMSSSYFLQRAITISPEYALKKIDLAELLVDRDMIENRILEIIPWQKKTSSGELAFLLAYIFYQNNNIVGAQRALDLAAEQMPENPALLSLKQVIDASDK